MIISHKKGENMEKIFYDNREVLLHYSRIISKKQPGIISFIKAFGKAFLSEYRISGDPHKFVFFNRINRKDHKELFNKVFDTCPFDKGFISWEIKIGFNMRFLVLWLSKIHHIHELDDIEIPNDSCKFELEYGKYIEMDLWTKVIVYTKLINDLNIKRAIYEFNWSNVVALVNLFDTDDVEHLMTTFANDKNIVTVSATHGIFYDFFDHRLFYTFNAWRDPSHFILAWGQSTVDLYRKYSPRCESIICGNPIIRAEKYSENSAIIGVALDVPRLRQYNLRLIHIVEEFARRFDKKVFIRIHPTDNESNYKLDSCVSEFNRNIDQASIIVAHTTVMVFSYLAMGKKVIRFRSDYPFYNLPDEICFSNYNEFEKRVVNIRSVKFDDISEYYIKFIGDDAVKKYRDAFIAIHNNSTQRGACL